MYTTSASLNHLFDTIAVADANVHVDEGKA